MEISENQLILLATVVIGLLVLLVVVFFSGKSHDNKAPQFGVDISVGLSKEQSNLNDNNNTKDERVLNPIAFRPFKVLKVVKVSHNTKLIRFEIPHGRSLGLTIGKHISVQAEISGSKVMRAYTPTSRIDQVGYFDLLVKAYEYGKMSTYLNSLKVGQSVDVRGPVGRFKYAKNSYPRIGLIGGGTGLTPCLQVIRTILTCPEFQDDQTSFTLFFQNRTEEDILLTEELEELEKKYAKRLQIFYFLSNAKTNSFATTNQREVKGYISKEMVQTYLAPNVTPLVCICGPSGFNNFVKGLLVAEGHDADKSVFTW